MSMARIDAGALLALGMDRQTVEALRHIIRQVGQEVGQPTLPYVSAQAAMLDLRASLTADVIAANTAADVPVVSLTTNKKLPAGMVLSGRIIGATSNGTTAGTLNLWLSVDGAKVFTHSFTTPNIPGANKGFAADFTLTVRAPGSAVAGGVLSLAYNAPTVLPSSSAAFPVPLQGVTFALGMNWTAADAANSATAKVAFLSVEKI